MAEPLSQSDSRRSNSRDFYTSTLQRMEEQDAEEANARMAERVNHGDSKKHKAAEEKLPEPAHVHDAVPPREQEAAQQKAGGVKKQETEEEHRVEQELGSILKRSPSTYGIARDGPWTRSAPELAGHEGLTRRSHNILQDILSALEDGQGHSPRKV